MSSAGDLFIRLQHITSLGRSDLNGDVGTAQMDLGTLSIVNDRFGYRMFRYFRNDSGSNFVKGECMSRAVNVAVANILSGTTTSATTTGLTADSFDHQTVARAKKPLIGIGVERFGKLAQMLGRIGRRKCRNADDAR